MNPVVSLLIGLAFAGLGGELFVRGAVGLASWARIPAGIIGATVAAFATSSPELAVAVNASVAGTPQIALGDALGSNVVNIGLILACALLFGPIQAAEGSLRRDVPVALATPFLIGFLVADGSLSRLDSGLILLAFVVWLGVTVAAARKARDAAEEVLAEHNHAGAILAAVCGLAFLVAAGDFIVVGAKAVGEVFGWSPFVTGATLVAMGTSMPELATTLISRLRGHDEVGLGTVLGSNIFNGLFIVSVAGLIAPIQVAPGDVLLGLGFGVLTVVFALPMRGGAVHRWRGAALIGLYALYVTLLINQSG